VNEIMNLRVARNAEKLSTGYTIGGLSITSQFHRVSVLVFGLYSSVRSNVAVNADFRIVKVPIYTGFPVLHIIGMRKSRMCQGSITA
jgi:hypothetical protein